MGYRFLVLLLGLVFTLAACSQSSNDLEAQAGSWQLLGPVKGTQGSFPPPVARMSLNSLGNPGVASFNTLPSFTYYDGTTWQGTGILDSSTGFTSVGGVDIVFDSLDRPVVAYTLSRGSGGNFIFVKRWNITTGRWGTIASLSLDTYPYKVELELASNTRPIIAYQTGPGGSTVHVKGWNGSSWTDYGNPETSAYAFSLALDKTKQPVLAYEKSGGGVQVLVKKWDAVASVWMPLGTSLNFISSGAKPPVIDTDANGNPVVAWSEYNNITSESSYIYVKRWNGNSWQQLGNSVTDNARVYNLDMDLDNEGNPYIAWQNDLDKAIYVTQWKAPESRWRFVGPNPISTLSGVKTGSIPSIDWRNNTLVTTWSRPSVVINGISYNGRILTKRYVP